MSHRRIIIRSLWIAGLAGLPLLFLLLLLGQAGATPADGEAQLRLLASDSEGLVAELVVPSYRIQPVTVDGLSYVEVEAAGLEGRAAESGAPVLPGLGRLVALPPGAEVQLSILAVETETKRLAAPILPAPTLVLTGDGSPVERRLPWREGGSPSGLYPLELVSAGEPAYLRDQRVVRLDFNPVQIDRARDALVLARRLVVRVSFVGQETTNAGASLGFSAAAEAIFQAELLNYDQGRAWRGLPAGFESPEPALAAGTVTYRIEVDTDGLYRVTYDDLLAAGLEVTHTNPLSFALTSQGELVAIELIGDGDSQFESGDGFYFYGRRFRGSVMESKYTDVNVYWLTADGPAGARMGTVDGTPHGAPAATSYRAVVHEEQDLLWNPIRTTVLGDQDTWFWRKAVANPPALPPTTRMQYVELTTPAAGNYTATVTATLFSEGYYSDYFEKHHAEVYFNNRLIDEQGQDGSWRNIAVRVLTGPISQSHLVSGTNELKWVLRSDVVGQSVRGVYLNWYEVAYQRLFVAQGNELAFGGDVSGTWTYSVTGLISPIGIWDISSPFSPTRVLSPAIVGGGPQTVTFQAAHPDGARFFAVGASAVRAPLSVSRYLAPDLDPPGGADWIAITHPGFYTQVQRLADRRSSQGLRTVVVDAEDVYNLYSYGIYQPAAVRALLAHALTWPGLAPAYALLVGDGHWNFKQVPGYAPDEPIYIPPYLGFLDPYQGEVPADNLYVTLVGTDALPDMALGRLPVRTLSEAEMVVDKIISHETALLYPQPWQFTVVLLADDPDGGGDFHSQSDRVAALLPDYMAAIKLYYPISVTHPPTDVVMAFNDGVTLLNYRGHGALDRWAANPALFDVSSVQRLNNTGRQPIVLTMDCLDAYFAYPGNPAVSEELLRWVSGGSAGHWGSSGLGLSDDHSVLHESFYRRLFQDGLTRLGQLTMAAKVDFSTGGLQQHNLHTFTLLGDPAMPVMAADLQLDKAVASSGPFFPGGPITYTLAYSNAGLYWGNLAVISDLLPSQLLSLTVRWAGLPVSASPGVTEIHVLSPMVPYGGGLVTVTGWVDPLLDATAGLWLTNTASVAAPGLDWQTGNNGASASAWIVQPRLGLAKAAPAVAGSGGPLTYTLWVTNEGSGPAQRGWLVDQLPLHTGLLAASSPYTFANGAISWTFTLSPSQAISRQLVVEVEPGLVGQVSNDSYRAWADYAQVAAGSAVTTQVAPAPIASFELSNANPDAGQPVYLTSTSQFHGTPAFAWDMGDGLGTAVGPTAVYSYSTTGPFTVTLTVQDEFGTDSAQQVVDPLGPRIALAKTAPAALRVGTPLTYTLRVTNTGFLSVTGGRLVDTLPWHTSFFSASGVYTLSGDVLTWTFMLDVGQAITRHLVVTIEPGFTGVISNTDYWAVAYQTAAVAGDPVTTRVARPPVFLPIVLRGS